MLKDLTSADAVSLSKQFGMQNYQNNILHQEKIMIQENDTHAVNYKKNHKSSSVKSEVGCYCGFNKHERNKCPNRSIVCHLCSKRSHCVRKNWKLRQK